MKKKIVSMLGVMTLMVSLLAGCGSSTSTETADTSSDSETTESQSETDDSTGLANPWEDCTSGDILDNIGVKFYEADGVIDPKYQLDWKDLIGQMTFTDEAGTEFCARVQSTDEAEDISGAYYDWADTTECMVNGTDAGYCYAATDGDQMIQLCTWYSEDDGLSYSLMAEGKDLDGMDIQGWAEMIYPSVKSPVITDTSSFEAIISQLRPGYAYAYADMDPDNDVLLVSTYTYDNGDGNMATIDATIYAYGPDGDIMKYDYAQAGGTAYPLAISDHCLMVGSNHSMMKEYVDESTGSMMTKEYASESFDEEGNTYYSYMSLEDGEESTPTDDSKLKAMFEEYSSATVLNFTIVE